MIIFTKFIFRGRIADGTFRLTLLFTVLYTKRRLMVRVSVLKKTRKKEKRRSRTEQNKKTEVSIKHKRAGIKNQSFTYNLFSRVFWRSSLTWL